MRMLEFQRRVNLRLKWSYWRRFRLTKRGVKLRHKGQRPKAKTENETKPFLFQHFGLDREKRKVANCQKFAKIQPQICRHYLPTKNGAMVVAQLAERLLPIPEIGGSHPNIRNDKFVFERNYLSIATQKRR